MIRMCVCVCVTAAFIRRTVLHYRKCEYAGFPAPLGVILEGLSFCIPLGVSGGDHV